MAKKFKIFDLDDQIIENEFALIKEKYHAELEQKSKEEGVKKN